MSSSNSWLADLPDPEFYAQLTQNFALLMVCSVAYLGLTHNLRGAASFVVGALVSAGNFWLLSHSIPRLVGPDLAVSTRRTSRVVRRALLEFLGRYVVVGAVAFWAIRYHGISLEAFAMGLSLPVFAVMLQAVRMMVSLLRT